MLPCVFIPSLVLVILPPTPHCSTPSFFSVTKPLVLRICTTHNFRNELVSFEMFSFPFLILLTWTLGENAGVGWQSTYLAQCDTSCTPRRQSPEFW